MRVNNTKGQLYWITGLSGAGKTTIGSALYYEMLESNPRTVLLDGDMLKEIVDGEAKYSDQARRERAYKYAKMCRMLVEQGVTVICCTIAMYEEVREWNRNNIPGYVEVYLEVPLEVLMERDQKGMYSEYQKGARKQLAGVDLEVEFPRDPDIKIINDGAVSVKDCVSQIMSYASMNLSDYDRDVEYWNAYYKKQKGEAEPSLFGKYVLQHMKEESEVLDIGCGNGRDSRYFARNGHQVVGVDASDSAIKELNSQNIENSLFVCDDFAKSSTIYLKQYDYCYSRFTMHAINDSQQEELVHNVYGALKKDGKFFIEVRSVNDSIYGKGEQVGRNAFIYNNHFRRFLVKEELEAALEKIGFTIEEALEERGFAPYGDDDSPIIRIIAKK